MSHSKSQRERAERSRSWTGVSSPRSLSRGAATAASLVLMLACGAANATDDIHDCDVVGRDRSYQLNAFRDNDELVLQRRNSTEKIPYDNITRHRLSEVSGFCNSIAAKKRYRFKTEVYGVTIEFTDKGQKHVRKFRCERVVDASPAGAKCDREVKTLDWKAPEARFLDYQ